MAVYTPPTSFNEALTKFLNPETCEQDAFYYAQDLIAPQFKHQAQARQIFAGIIDKDLDFKGSNVVTNKEWAATAVAARAYIREHRHTDDPATIERELHTVTEPMVDAEARAIYKAYTRPSQAVER